MSRVGTALAGMLDTALDLLLPAVCPACRIARGPALCVGCVAVVPRPQDPCPWCGAPRAQQNPRHADDAEAEDDDATAPGCRACRNRGLPGIARVHVGCVYAGVVEELVGNAKAGARPAAVRACGELMPAPAASAGAVVVPIPPARGRRPGPHLATALARMLARRLGLPCRRLLRTSRLAAEQHLLGHAERRRNVEDLFRVRGPAPAQVLLVDDLVTTGATAVAAAAALRAAGAQRVELLCLARTPRAGEAVRTTAEGAAAAQR